jgi:lysozyme family protein
VAQYSFAKLRAEYQRLWSEMTVLKEAAAEKQARKVIANKARYKQVEQETTVPWFVVGCLHMRESNGDFDTYLGNGQPLDMVTTIVPKGRGPFDSFLDGAIDAITLEGLDKITDWGAEHVAYPVPQYPVPVPVGRDQRSGARQVRP